MWKLCMHSLCYSALYAIPYYGVLNIQFRIMECTCCVHAPQADLLKSVWGGRSASSAADAPDPPRLYATGTNDCQRRNNSDTMAALLPGKLGMKGGFSWHSYPVRA